MPSPPGLPIYPPVPAFGLTQELASVFMLSPAVSLPVCVVHPAVPPCSLRLTQQLHKMYTSNRAYYAASTLGGLTHADQRITEDVEKFCFSISDLYSHTFKVGYDLIRM